MEYNGRKKTKWLTEQNRIQNRSRKKGTASGSSSSKQYKQKKAGDLKMTKERTAEDYRCSIELYLII